MTRIAITILLFGLLAASVTASDARVSSIALNHAETGTIAAIEASEQVRFSHQTEVAKDGKPFRVIVDILSATHHLGAKVFEQIPDCIVSSIRTSQYSVKPEKVVRVVFDMKRETAYQITTEGNTVRVSFPDRETPTFSSWESRSWLGSEQEPVQHARGFKANKPTEKTLSAKPRPESGSDTVDHLNKAIDTDRMASLQGANKGPRPQTSNRLDTALTYQSPTPPAAAGTDDRSEWDSVQLTGTARKYSDGDMYANPHTEQVEPVVARTSREEPAETQRIKVKGKPESTGAVKKSQHKAEFAHADQPPAPADSAVSQENIVAVKPAKKQSPPSTQPVPDNAPAAKADDGDEDPPQLAKGENETEEPDQGQIKTPSSRSSTARFRRSPEMSRKLKGTMVAEFPSRLVIKYNSSGRRDPFATLINEARLKSGAMEDRIPNVDGLRLVGVIESAEGRNSALFEDSEGYGYILKAGDKVRRGYVLRVESDRAYFQIFEYGWSRTIALNIEDQ